MDVLVISGGSTRTAFEASPVACETVDATDRTALVERYPAEARPAAELFLGREHETVARAVGHLETVAAVDWQILTPGFGLVGPETDLVATDCTFADVGALEERARSLDLDTDGATYAETRQAVSRALGLHASVSGAIEDGPDIVLLALTGPYFEAIEPALYSIPEATTAIAIAAEGASGSVGECHWLPATDRERILLGSNWVELRGALLEGLAAGIDDVDALARIAERPSTAYFRSLGLS